MVLRKPYAFLIKHFKFIHLILAVLTYYSIYKTKVLLDFFNDYVANPINIAGQELESTFISTFYKTIPFLIIFVTLIILLVMIVKKKPLKFYITNIIVYIFTLTIILIASSTFKTMYYAFTDIRRIRLVRDLVLMAFFVQFISAIIVTIRATGFDIKKFDFKEDLKELEISEEDREEFELEFSFDKNKILRKIRKNTRYFIYSYKENKLIYNIIATCALVSIIYFIYTTFFYTSTIVNQNSIFSGNGFSLSIVDSYLMNTDYKGNVIDPDNYYLLLRVKIRNNIKDSKLDTATTKIMIGNYYYTPTYKNNEKFIDFGEIYYNELIGTEYEYKNLLYEIPKQLINNKFIFSYVNKNILEKKGFKSTGVTVNYTDLTGVSSRYQFNLGDELSLSETVLSNINLKINNYDIQDKYKISYNYYLANETITSFEYLKPKLNTNYDKVLLKIDGDFSNEDNNKINNLYTFIENFGRLYYQKDGKLNEFSFNSNLISSNKVKLLNTYYIEVPKEIISSDNIYFVFKVRDKIYEYVLK